jgi:hypothetical protein
MDDAHSESAAVASVTFNGSHVLASGYSVDWEVLDARDSRRQSTHRSRRTYFTVAACASAENRAERTLHRFASPSDGRPAESVRMSECLWLVDGATILLQTSDARRTWLLVIDASDPVTVERWRCAILPDPARICRHLDELYSRPIHHGPCGDLVSKCTL